MIMKILGIDVGVHTGLVLYNSESFKVEYNFTFKADDVLEFAEQLNPLMHKFNFDLVVTAYPTRVYSVIVSQSKKLGIVEYFASLMDKEVVYTNDSSAKKVVFGSGRMEKTKIHMNFKELGYNLDTEHENDSLMFARWYQLKTL